MKDRETNSRLQKVMNTSNNLTKVLMKKGKFKMFSIIEPKYKSEDIENLHKSSTCSMKNKYYAAIKILNYLLNVTIFILSANLTFNSEMYSKAVSKVLSNIPGVKEFIQYAVTELVLNQGATLSTMEFVCIVSLILTATGLYFGLPPVILLYIKNQLIIPPLYKHFVKKGNIIESPFQSRSDFLELKNYYMQAEGLINTLHTYDKVEFYYDKQEQKIRVTIINPVISKERVFNFGQYTENIFLEDKIDFSLLDKSIDRRIENNKKQSK